MAGIQVPVPISEGGRILVAQILQTIKGYCEHLYTNKVEHFNEMDKFHEKSKLTNWCEKKQNLNSCTSVNKI